MLEDYDVIVIGSGVGGTGCGAILAHAGLKTLILERNARLGGACSSYVKEGFTIDVACHFFSHGMQGRFGKILNRIGMVSKKDGKLVSDVLQFNSDLTSKGRIKFKGRPGYTQMGMDLTLGSKSQAEAKETKEVDEKSGFKKAEQKELVTVIGSMLQMSKKKIRELAERQIDLKSWVSEITTNKKVHDFVAMMCGTFFTIPPRLASASEYIICLQETVFSNDTAYPLGGSIAIPTAFAQGILKYGGEVRTNANVSKIIIENNRVVGVICNDKEIRGKIIVSNAGIKRTVSELVGESYFEKEYVQFVKDLMPSYSAIAYKFALSKPLIKEDFAFVQLTQTKFGPLADKGDEEKAPMAASYLMPIPSNMDPHLAPPGKQLIIVGTAAPPFVKNWKRWTAIYYQDILSFYPELEDLAEFVDTTTPLDIVKYIGKEGGPVEGTALTPSQSGKNRISSELPIEGLYVVGDTAGVDTHGVGTQLAADSALKGADLILMKYKKLITHPAPM
ncbi:MAG TPA: NAD(P)/FAD-dependent oxidoreductase [Candidatus Deferrimicrobium sp.]|nr:NAD(P)/FAD-dependent oxidoreductase [Candidatus Deferrimicrobium sp.]